jgi:hypothetical protein
LTSILEIWTLLRDNTDKNYVQMSDVTDTNKSPY